LKVAVADDWISKRQVAQTIPQKSYDWTFTTSYKGTLIAPEGAGFGVAEPTTERIDLDKLRVPDPILFFEDLILFEDEFDDNGIGQLNVKVVRVSSFSVHERREGS
jgi:type 2A phosphatase activator TIP41